LTIAKKRGKGLADRAIREPQGWLRIWHVAPLVLLAWDEGLRAKAVVADNSEGGALQPG